MKAFCCVFIFFCSVCFCSNESYWDLRLRYSQDELRIQAAQVNLSRFDPNYQEKYDRLSFALKELELKQRELEVNYKLDQLNGWKGPESQKYEAEKKLLAYKRKLAELEVFQKTVNSSVSSDLAMQQLALQEEMIQNTPMPQVGQPRSRQTRIRPSYVSVGHRAGRGVGYKKGYSSAALFLTPSWNRLFQPFLDFRGHVFNDGRFASNLGAGIRFISENEMAAFGVNIYHDFRSTHDLHAHQLGVGLEGLGRYFDFRVNGYFPIANDVKSHKIEFDQFVGNNIQLKRRVKIAIPSVNAEIGVPIPGINCRKINLYLAASPYYLFGKRVNEAKFSNAFGWKGKLSAKLFDRLSLEVVVSHDHIFHTRAQGYASYSIPLGRKPKDFKASTCAKDAFIARTKAPAMRNEIIPMKKKEPRFFLKDAGGDNLHVVFVNNLAGCPGAGTFLDPFCTLALAEATGPEVDLIYVFEGNGTTSGYNAGFAMKVGQQLHGSSQPFVFQGVTIPALTSGNPSITNVGAPVITLANNSILNGLTLVQVSGQHIVSGNGVGNILIENSTFTGGGVGDVSAIELAAVTGNNVVRRNTFNGISSTGRIIRVPFVSSSTLTVEHNAFNNYGGNTANRALILGPTSVVKDNTFYSLTGTPPTVDINVSGNGNHVVDNNMIITNSDFNIVVDTGNTIITDNTIARSNLAAGTARSSIRIEDGFATQTFVLVNNHITTTGAFTAVHGIQFDSPSAATGLRLENNVILTGTGFGINILTSTAAGSVCADVTGNTAPEFIFFATPGSINLQQTQAELEMINFADPFGFMYTGVVNFGSSCIAP